MNMFQSVETKHQEPCRIQTDNPMTHHDQLAKPCSLFLEASVIVRDYSGSKKLIPSVVQTKLGPVTYTVIVSHRCVMK